MSYRKLRVLLLCIKDLVPPPSLRGLSASKIQRFRSEYDVYQALVELGHEVKVVGIFDDLDLIHTACKEFKPQIAFNLIEEFHGFALFDQHIVSYLELLRIPYTGCNPRGLTLAHDKALSKRILAHAGVRVPNFDVFYPEQKFSVTKQLRYPLFVKSLIEEGSLGISYASLVRNERELKRRVKFVHRKLRTPAIAEEFIDGRELYVAVLGNQSLKAFKPLEFTVKPSSNRRALIATSRVKWNATYQRKIGARFGAAKLTPRLERELAQLSKQSYKLLNLSGFARLDYRLDETGAIYLIEANPNPNLAKKEDFANAARLNGLNYPELIQKLIELGLSYRSVFERQ